MFSRSASREPSHSSDFATASSPSVTARLRPSIRSVPLLLLVVCLASGAFLRFFALDQQGLGGSDSIYYTYIAKAWSEGDFVDRIGYQIQVSRPVVFALFAAAIKIFGFHDHAIKTLNALLDTANVLLVFLVTFLISRGRTWVALAPTIPYASLPIAIHMSRVELTHISSTFFVLLSLISFVLYFQAVIPFRRRSYLGVAGLLVALAALTHEDLIFLAPGYLLFLVMSQPRALSTVGGRRRLVIDLLIFGSAPLLVTRWLLTAEGPQVVGAVNRAGRRLGWDHVWTPLERFWRYGYDAIIAGTSSVVLCLFILGFVGLLWNESRQRRRAPDTVNPHDRALLYLPLTLIAIYLVLSAWLFGRFFMRLFLPFLPLVLISVALWLSRVLDLFVGRCSAVAAVVLCALTVPFNLSQYGEHERFLRREYMAGWANAQPRLAVAQGYDAMVRRNYATSWSRRIWDDLEHRVDQNARLLVSSALVDPTPGRRTLQIGYYFGDNAVYVIDHDEPLDEIIRRNNIKYVLFTRWKQRKALLNRTRYPRYLYSGRWEHGVPLTLGKAYGFAPGEYTVATEYEYLTSYLAARGARAIVFNGKEPTPSTEPPSIDTVGYIVYEL